MGPHVFGPPAMSAKKKKRPTFVAENGNVQIPIYTIKRGRSTKKLKCWWRWRSRKRTTRRRRVTAAKA